MLSSEGKVSPLQTVGLAAAGGNMARMCLQLEETKKKKSGKKKEQKRRREKRRRRGGRGGQMCLQVRSEASGWRCETAQRVTPHLLHIEEAAECFPDNRNIWKNGTSASWFQS